MVLLNAYKIRILQYEHMNDVSEFSYTHDKQTRPCLSCSGPRRNNVPCTNTPSLAFTLPLCLTG